MKLQLILTQRQVDALKAAATEAASNAEVMVNEKDKVRVRTGLQVENGVALIKQLISMATIVEAGEKS